MGKNRININNVFNKAEFKENLEEYSKEYERHISNKKIDSPNNKLPDNDSVTRGSGSIHSLTDEEFYGGLYD